MDRQKIVTFGEIMLRLTPPDYLRFNQTNLFRASYGGSEANVAVSLANYGLQSEFVTRLPDNRVADACIDDLRRYGVRTDAILRGGKRLGIYYMEEAADADYVVILDNGKIAAEGTPLALKNAYTGDFITLYGSEESQIKQLGAPYETIRDAYRVSVPNTAAATELILKFPEIFQDYEITKGKMDDVFLAVTGKKLIGGAGR